MGTRLLLSRSREREESESEPDDESDSDPDEPELESESESEPESESESDSEPEEDLLVELCVRAASQYDSPDGHGCSTDRLRFLCGGSFPSASLARAFSFSFNILFAVPALQNHEHTESAHGNAAYALVFELFRDFDGRLSLRLCFCQQTRLLQ